MTLEKEFQGLESSWLAAYSPAGHVIDTKAADWWRNRTWMGRAGITQLTTSGCERVDAVMGRPKITFSFSCLLLHLQINIEPAHEKLNRIAMLLNPSSRRRRDLEGVRKLVPRSFTSRRSCNIS
jgi:hypothetical protein